MRTLRLVWLMVVDACRLWADNARPTHRVGAALVTDAGDAFGSSWAAPATSLEDAEWLTRDLVARTTRAGS